MIKFKEEMKKIKKKNNFFPFPFTAFDLKPWTTFVNHIKRIHVPKLQEDPLLFVGGEAFGMYSKRLKMNHEWPLTLPSWSAQIALNS